MDEIDGKLQLIAAEEEVLLAQQRLFRRDCTRWVLYDSRWYALSLPLVFSIWTTVVGLSVDVWFFMPLWAYYLAAVSGVCSFFGFAVVWKYPHIRTFDPHAEVEEMRNQLFPKPDE